MKKIFLLLSIATFSYAQTIDSLIESAYVNNYNLKAMNKELEISRQNSIISDEWDNPTLSVGISDLQFDDITNRKLEPMQTQFVMLTQSIPLNNKKGLSKEISKQKEKLTSFTIDIQKAKIASIITTLSYKALIQDRYLDIFERKIANLKKMKRLTNAYQLSSEQSLFIELEMLKLENKKESKKEKKDTLLQQIEKLTISDVTDIQESLEFKDLSHMDISKHPKIEFLKQQIKVEKEVTKLQLAKKLSDIKVTGGYYQRDARDDYVNLSFSMPLTLGKSEDVEVIKSKLKVKQFQHKLKDTINSFENEIKILKQKAKKAKNNHERYTNSLIPKQRKIIKLIKQKSKLSHATLIDLLKAKNGIFSLEELALKELEEYFETYGKLRYFR